MQWSCNGCDSKFSSIKEYIAHLKSLKCNADVENVYRLGIITEEEYNTIKRHVERKSA